MFVSSLLVSLTTSIYLATPASAQSMPYSQGDLFAATASNTVIEYTPLGKIVQTLSTGSSYEMGMCFDSQENLYVTNFGGYSMSKFDSQGNLLSSNYVGPFSGSPESCAFMANGNMIVGQVDSGELYEFSPTGSLIKTFFPQTQNLGIDWISLASDGYTLYYTSEGSSVLRYNICTRTQEADFVTGLPGPCYANQIAGNGDFFVACASEVADLTPSGSLRRTYSVPDTSFLFAFTLDPSGTSFWTADYNTGEIVEIDIANGSVLSSFSAGQSIQGLAQLGSNGPVGGAITPIETLGGHNPSEKGAHQCSQGSPVNCATGDFWHTFTDALVAGPSPYLDLSRTYNSLVASIKGSFGYGWSSSYTMHLVFDSTTGDVTVCQENGSIVTFTPNSTGTYSAPPRVDATLVQNSDGSYSLTRDKWETFTFNSSGCPTSEQDVSDYKTTLPCNSVGQLISVTDFAGRSLDFTYSANGLVSSVTDPMVRATTYKYDSNGNLISATDPMGRVTSFTYNVDHLLLTMTDPMGHAATQDAVSNPVQVVPRADGSYKYIGQNAVVVLNSDGEVITTYVTHAAGVRVVIP